MKQFHREIKKVSQDLQYCDLLKLFGEYKSTKSQQIRDQIFYANVKLVFSITAKYKDNLDDVEQYGFIGLINAIENFNPELNYKFSTYATRCIRNEIHNGLNRVSNVIPIPQHMYQKVKAGDLQEITLHDIENFDIETELEENGIDKQLFWFMINKLTTDDELDLLLKRYCSDDEMQLKMIAQSINESKQFTHNKLKRIIKRLKKNVFFKNMIKESL